MITVVQLSSVIWLYDHGWSNAWTIVRISQNYSSRFATRPARTQGIGQRGKKQAYLVQQSRLGSNLAVLGPKWRNLGPFDGSFTPSWAQRRHWLCSPFWSYMDLNLGRSWGQVAPSWTEVGPKLKGALLPEVDPKWSRCCGHVGPKRCIWTILGRSAKCANYDSPVHSLAACSVRKCHPQLKLYQTGRSVHSYHSLLNYHAVMYQNNIRAIVEHQ